MLLIPASFPAVSSVADPTTEFWADGIAIEIPTPATLARLLGHVVPTLTPELVDIMLGNAVPTEDVAATARRFGVELHHLADVWRSQ